MPKTPTNLKTMVIVMMTDGTEEIEFVTIVDGLRRANIKVVSVGLTTKKAYTGAHGIQIAVDEGIDFLHLNWKHAAGIVLPGGPGHIHFIENVHFLGILKEMFYHQKLVAAICASPVVLETAEILNGQTITVYPSFRDQIKIGKLAPENTTVFKSNNIITGIGPAASIEFVLLLVTYLLGEQASANLLKY